MTPTRMASALTLALCLSTAGFASDPATVGNPESLGFSTARLQRIGAWYRARVDAGELPGAVVAIARNGRLAYLEAVGFQDNARTIPMKPDAIFWIASMTKPVTSVAAMMLVEQGKLDLDAPVSQYLPQLKNMQVGVEKPDPVTGRKEIALEPPKRLMTVRDLLRHTSGLVYPPQFNNSAINRLYNKAVFEGDKTLADFVASLADLPLAHQPGEVWEYSWGVDVLARVVEVASGLPFDQFLQDRIFGPLRMVDTGFYVAQEKLARLVDAPEPRGPQFDVTRPRKLLSGGGGLVSTAADYLRFCQMLLNGGELDGAKILTRQTVQLMTTNSLPADIRSVGEAIGPARGASWGLGFAIRTGLESSQVPGSVGSYSWNGVWGTFFWIDPAEKMIALLMIQVVPGKISSFAAIRNLAYGALQVPEPQSSLQPSEVAVSADTLTDYAGTYDFGLSSSSRDRRDPVVPSFAGIGINIEIAEGGVRIISVRDNAPAAKAGIKAGDFITYIDGAPVKGLKIDRIIGKLRGAANSLVRLKLSRAGLDDPLELAIIRAIIYVPAVELQVRTEAGKLVIEATGPWPVLDFEKGKPVAVIAASASEFYVDGGDHTRIAFVRDAAGKVSGAILNPGQWEQKGGRIDQPL
jgi:CubicO group peptidase (beta-lactamase class C family)